MNEGAKMRAMTDRSSGNPDRLGLALLVAVIAVCAGAELLFLAADWGVLDIPRLRQRAYDNGAFRPQLLLGTWRPNYAAQPWTMFLTYGFLHGGPIHMLVNMATLWSIGLLVLDRIGPKGLALLYLGALLGGAVAYGVISESLRLMVGASGALFGLAGAMVIWLWVDRDLHAGNLRLMWNLLGYLLAMNLVMYWALDGQLAWETHLGGFLVGCGLGYTLDRPRNEHSEAEIDPPEPRRLTYLVGDIHGCFAQLDNMLDQIAQHRNGRPADLVFLGDYVDRGPDSAGVLERLMELERSPDVTCLMGNHDVMMLGFLDEPTTKGTSWMINGGQEALISFGLNPMVAAPDAASRQTQLAQGLRAAMPDGLEDWIRTRPLWWQSGNVIAAHALTIPDAPMSEQSDAVLLWARPKKDTPARYDGTWVVHGHTIVPEPRITPGYIAIDTGVFRTGRLTAVVLGDGPTQFLQATTMVAFAEQTG